MKTSSVSAILVVLLVAAFCLSGPVVQSNATANNATTSNLKRFGFGFVNIGALSVAGYSATTFFNAMFLTAPYPSTVEFLMNNGISEITDPNNVNFLLTNMQMASQYPNIQLGLHVAFDVRNRAQWSQFQTVLNTLAASPYKSSLGFIGFAWEQVNILTATHNSTYPTYASALMQSKLSAAGFQFISYYCGSSYAPYLCLQHTNYPEGDDQNALTKGSGKSNMVGATIGVDGIQPFPSPGCTSVFGSGSTGMPGWSTHAYPEGYLGTGYNNIGACNNIVTHAGFPPTVDQVLTAEASMPLANSKYTFLIAGNAGTCFLGGTCGATTAYFTGVSGHSTVKLWDSPIFRSEMSNWLAANPGTYITSNGNSLTSATVLSCSRSSVVGGTHVRCEATVTGSSPTGKVTWVSSGSGKFSQTSCQLVGRACSVMFTPTSAVLETTIITANYKGDSHNAPSADRDPLGVTKASPTITTTLSHLAILAGQSVYDSATLKGGFQAGGTVTYEYFPGGTCSGTPAKVGVAVTVKNGVVPNSASHAFSTAKSYSWKALYSGDANNKAATSQCERMTVVPPTTPPTYTTITCTKSSFAVGTRITCTAIVTGGYTPRTGTITWSKASGTGGVTFSSKTCTLMSGRCWVTLKATVRGSITIKATYSGDPRNPWSSGTIVLTIT
jgi:hypothetical protein